MASERNGVQILNFRYHLLTLIAIFFALGVGILVGSTMFVRDGLLDEQKRLIQRMEGDFQYLREENRDLRERIDGLKEELVESEERMAGLFRILSDQGLKERRIALVNSSGADLEETHLLPLLSLAAARVDEFTESKELVEGDYHHLLLLNGEQQPDKGLRLDEEDLYLPGVVEVLLNLFSSPGGETLGT